MDGRFNWDLYRELPVVGILRGFEEAAVGPMVRAAVAGGVRNIEVTMNTDAAEALIEAVRAEVGSEANVGAGTVCDLFQLGQALNAGAEFIVTPVVSVDVICACVDQDIPVIPGAFTPTEIWQAFELGADVVKLFPAHRLGPGYLQDLRGPLDKVPIMPVGGITAEGMLPYLEAGADGFGVGSSLFDSGRVLAQDWDWIREQAGLYFSTYRRWRPV